MILIRNLKYLLTSDEQKKVKNLGAVILLSSLFEMLGVASIFPFITLLSTGSEKLDNEILLYIYITLDFTKKDNFIIFIGCLVLITLIFSLGFRALTIYIQSSFVMSVEKSLATRLLRGYLGQSYSWFLRRHSAELGKNILSEVDKIANGLVMPLLVVVSQFMIAITIFILLLIIEPWLSISATLMLTITYLIIYLFLRNGITKSANSRVVSNKDRYQSINEAFGAIKEIKLNGHEYYYVDKFTNPASQYAQSNAKMQVISQIPRFFLEGIAFGGMILIILFLISRGMEFQHLIPTLTLFAYATYRILPAMQQIYWGIAQLKFHTPVLSKLYDEIVSLDLNKEIKEVSQFEEEISKIVLSDISYRYPESGAETLKNINMTIIAKSAVGIVGGTGAGKTTLVDLILGLLTPTNGSIYINNKKINLSQSENFKRKIAYVPQQIYLSDDTVAANIAFGIPEKEIDKNKLERAAKLAEINEFIINHLPHGYKTTVGERGVRLSGGQRQRIGIARALYKEPELLVLDEATSALDNLTESNVMEAITQISKELIVVIIAHRLASVKQCDNIYILEEGQVTAEGRFDELSNKNQYFKKIIELG